MAKQTVNNGESGLIVRGKINDNFTELYGIDSGVLNTPYELTFDTHQRYRTISVTSDITLTLAASGKIAHSIETIKTTGDGSHTLSFPAGWVIVGDTFNFNKIQQLDFTWDGEYVIGVITTLDSIAMPPLLTSATIESLTNTTLDLVFNEAVNITTSGWSISASGGAVTILSVASGNGTVTPKFTLSRAIDGSETLTISYSGGTTASLDSLPLATITDEPVTNNTISIIMFDNFDDASIDLAKWDVTDPADGVTISETGGRLRFTCNPASAVASSNTNVIETDNAFDWNSGVLRVVRFTLYRNAQAINHTRAIQIAKDTSNGIKIICTNDTTVTIKVTVANVDTYSVDTGIAWDAIAWKIIYKANFDIEFYSWGGSSWLKRGSTQNHDFGTTLFVRMGVNSSASDTGTPTVEMDDFYLTNKDYTTLTP